MRSRLKGSIPPQLSYESQLGLFFDRTLPIGSPVVPGVVPRLRTLRVEWQAKHLASSTETPLDRAGNRRCGGELPGTMSPISGIASRTISWNRKFFWVASHCMYSIALGWAPGYEVCSDIPM